MILDYLLNKLSGYLKGSHTYEGKIIDPTLDEPDQIRRAKLYHSMDETKDNNKLGDLLGFNPATTPWCAGFVNAIEKQCGRKGTGQMLARSYLKYGTPVSTPKLGDIVVFKRGNSSWQGHVGYYISEGSDGILSLGGNQSNKVCYKYYPKKDVLGYRRSL